MAGPPRRRRLDRLAIGPRPDAVILDAARGGAYVSGKVDPPSTGHGPAPAGGDGPAQLPGSSAVLMVTP